MNSEYTYIDGKVIISDEYGDKIQSEYYDNLDEVLIQENVIETMEKEIKKLEKESEIYKNSNKRHYIPTVLPITIFASTIGTPLFSNWITNSNQSEIMINTIFGPMSLAMLTSIMMSFSAIPIGTLIELNQYNEHKNYIKKEKGINSKLTFLEKQIKIEKKYLEELKQDKSKENESTIFRTIKVDDVKHLNNLKQCLNLYFDLGYNLEKYYKYYQKGILDKKLQKNYNDKGIQIAKEYLEEKGPSLILSKKK